MRDVMSNEVTDIPRPAGASVTMYPADVASCVQAQTTRQEAAPQLVGDVMLRTPKTLPGRATIDDARALFANPKVVSALVVDGDKFVGLLDRSDLPSLLAGSTPIRTFVRREVPTITPDRPVSEATDILDAWGLARLVVLAEDGATLAGLLCLDLQRAGFCAD